MKRKKEINDYQSLWMYIDIPLTCIVTRCIYQRQNEGKT